MIIFSWVAAKLLFSGMSSASELPLPGVKIDVFGTHAGSSQSPTARVFQSEEIQKSPSADLSDFFRSRGEAILSSGGEGSQSFLFLKGGDPDKVLVLLDGVPLNDPTSPNRGFDFSQISLAGIDRIEILSGPQNIRYGGQALSGVVRLFSKRQAAEGASHDLKVAIGNWQREHYQVSSQWRRNRWSLGADAESFKLLGPSAAVGGVERDGVQRVSLGANAAYTPSEGTSFQWRSHFFNQKTDLDGGPFIDVSDFFLNTERWAHSGTYQKQLGRFWNLMVSGGRTITRRSVQGNDQDGWFYGFIDRSEVVSEYHLGRLSLISGSELNSEQAQFDQTFQTNSVQLSKQSANKIDFFFLPSYQLLKKLKVSGGLRTENHSVFGESTVGETQLDFFVDEKNLFYFRYSQGQKFPSLDQLFGPFGGNDQLRPEKMRGLEVGWKTETDQLGAVIEIFEQNYRDQIGFDQNFINLNIDRSLIRGIENQLSIWLTSEVRLSHRYQYTHTEQSESRALLRRPYHQSSQDIEWKPNTQWTYSLQHRMVGERWDFLEPGVSIKMPSFSLWSASSRFQWSKNSSLLISCDNILNKSYQEIFGYNGMPRRWILSFNRHW